MSEFLLYAALTMGIFCLYWMRNSQESQVSRWMRNLVSATVCGFLLVAVAGGIERMYLYQTEHYPAWLASGQFGELRETDLMALRNGACKQHPIEILHKTDHVILRCGTWWYAPSTHTFIAKSATFEK